LNMITIRQPRDSLHRKSPGGPYVPALGAFDSSDLVVGGPPEAGARAAAENRGRERRRRPSSHLRSIGRAQKKRDTKLSPSETGHWNPASGASFRTRNYVQNGCISCQFEARPDSVCVRHGLAGWGGGTRNFASSGQIRQDSQLGAAGFEHAHLD
jgi:hypothetical protein